MKTSITKQFRFEAAHHLPFHNGLCRNPHGHGYFLEVSVSGSVKQLQAGRFAIGDQDPNTGMVCDFFQLNEIVDPIIKELDHTDLNHSAEPAIGAWCTTAEVLATGIAERIDRELPIGVRLNFVRLWETSKAYAEVSFDD